MTACHAAVSSVGKKEVVIARRAEPGTEDVFLIDTAPRQFEFAESVQIEMPFPTPEPYDLLRKAAGCLFPHGVASPADAGTDEGDCVIDVDREAIAQDDEGPFDDSVYGSVSSDVQCGEHFFRWCVENYRVTVCGTDNERDIPPCRDKPVDTSVYSGMGDCLDFSAVHLLWTGHSSRIDPEEVEQPSPIFSDAAESITQSFTEIERSVRACRDSTGPG